MFLFSAALCRGLIEATPLGPRVQAPRVSFPRLYAAASLKPSFGGRQLTDDDKAFSAALCRGLIEARPNYLDRTSTTVVFRGFMPRPH